MLVKSDKIIEIEVKGFFVEKQLIREVLNMGKHEWGQVIEILKEDKISKLIYNGNIAPEDTNVKFGFLYEDYKLNKRIPLPIARIILDYVAPDMSYNWKRNS